MFKDSVNGPKEILTERYYFIFPLHVLEFSRTRLGVKLPKSKR